MQDAIFVPSWVIQAEDDEETATSAAAATAMVHLSKYALPLKMLLLPLKMPSLRLDQA